MRGLIKILPLTLGSLLLHAFCFLSLLTQTVQTTDATITSSCTVLMQDIVIFARRLYGALAQNSNIIDVFMVG